MRPPDTLNESADSASCLDPSTFFLPRSIIFSSMRRELRRPLMQILPAFGLCRSQIFGEIFTQPRAIPIK